MNGHVVRPTFARIDLEAGSHFSTGVQFHGPPQAASAGWAVGDYLFEILAWAWESAVDADRERLNDDAAGVQFRTD